MGYFDTLVFQKITTNPFTITFSNFTTTIDSYAKITIEEVIVGSSGLSSGYPINLYLDTNKTPFKNIDNTTSSKAAVIPLIDQQDIYTTYKYTNNPNSPQGVLSLPAATTSIQFTLKRGDNDTTVSMTDFQYFWVRMRIQGL